MLASMHIMYHCKIVILLSSELLFELNEYTVKLEHSGGEHLEGVHQEYISDESLV